jgi:diaminopimelate decarboxylase
MDPDADDELQYYDVVGPICESSDVWGNGRQLPVSYRGDLIAIRSAGAYGQTMASQYNMRDLAPAVFSDQM